MFEIGKEYPRTELLDFVGSKDLQSGVFWGNKEPNCIIITSGGEHALNSGYKDFKDDDGSWYYVGQGSSGDQSENNKANKRIINGDKDILLFTARAPTTKERKQRNSRGKLYKFEGIFNLLSYNTETPTEGIRANHKLLIFHLAPVKNILQDEFLFSVSPNKFESLEDLEKKILENVTMHAPQKKMSLVEFRERSLEVKVYALLRAKGVCELCNKEAPFISTNNTQFLEVHHIDRLCDDGLDLPQNVAAICPNCHREAHFGIRKDKIYEELRSVISKKVNQKLNIA